MKNYLKNLAYTCQGDIKKMYRLYNQKAVVSDYECLDKYITILDEEYPVAFKCLQYPPLVLFYKGNISLLKSNCISVVGSRICLDYCLTMTSTYCAKLASKYTIVSGLAKGIDSCAHWAAINNSGQTIGVLGCGLNVIYPRKNEDLFNVMMNNHLLISEYPANVKPLKWHFPVRNRLIVGLSSQLFVMSCCQKSGTMHSANLAADLNKEVFCLPLRNDDYGSDGILSLINDGAFCLCNEVVNNLLGVI